jgi:hypothetical protein
MQHSCKISNSQALLAGQNSRVQLSADVDAVAAVVKPALQFVYVAWFLNPPADQLPLGAGRQSGP